MNRFRINLGKGADFEDRSWQKIEIFCHFSQFQAGCCKTALQRLGRFDRLLQSFRRASRTLLARLARRFEGALSGVRRIV